MSNPFAVNKKGTFPYDAHDIEHLNEAPSVNLTHVRQNYSSAKKIATQIDMRTNITSMHEFTTTLRTQVPEELLVRHMITCMEKALDDFLFFSSEIPTKFHPYIGGTLFRTLVSQLYGDYSETGLDFCSLYIDHIVPGDHIIKHPTPETAESIETQHALWTIIAHNVSNELACRVVSEKQPVFTKITFNWYTGKMG